MRYANIKKASQANSKIKQKQQTIITSQTLSVLKIKFKNKVKKASDKTESKQNNL